MRKLLLLLLFFFLATSTVNATLIPTYESTDPDEDGYIHFNGAAYSRIAGVIAYCAEPPAGGNYDRAYIQWPTTSIPNNATILSVSITLTVTQDTGAETWYFKPITGKPSTATDGDLYTDVADGASYLETSEPIEAATLKTFYLGNVTSDDACVDLQALLASDWYAVGIYTEAAYHDSYFLPEEGVGDSPTLSVTYSTAGVQYTFTGKLEDNTDSDVTITALDSGGASSTFTILAGVPVTLGFTERPAYFTWNVSVGYYRRIYVLADTGSFTMTIPEATFAFFTPYIRDYTGITQDETTYLISTRSIGGVNTIIERVPIMGTVNGIPILLTVNRVYTLTIDTSTTDYAFSFYTTTALANPVLLMDQQTFDEVLQFNTRYIHVEASRPNATSIKWEYLDDLGHTTNVTLNAKTMGGIILHTHNIPGSSSFTYTWTGAVNTTDIIAEALITHSDFGNLTYRRPFGGAISLPISPPSLVGLGSFGGIDMSQVFGATILLAIAGLASAKNSPAVLVITAIMAAALSYYGFMAINTGLIVFVIGIALFYEMGRARA